MSYMVISKCRYDLEFDRYEVLDTFGFHRESFQEFLDEGASFISCFLNDGYDMIIDSPTRDIQITLLSSLGLSKEDIRNALMKLKSAKIKIVGKSCTCGCNNFTTTKDGIEMLDIQFE